MEKKHHLLYSIYGYIMVYLYLSYFSIFVGFRILHSAGVANPSKSRIKWGHRRHLYVQVLGRLTDWWDIGAVQPATEKQGGDIGQWPVDVGYTKGLDKTHMKSQLLQSSQVSKYYRRFPRIGVPLVIIPFHGIFYYKPTSYWDAINHWNPPSEAWRSQHLVMGNSPEIQR